MKLFKIAFYVLTALLLVLSCSDDFIPSDADEDGIDDTIDLCPDTPFGEAVSENGCPVRSAVYLDVNGVTIKAHEWAEVGQTGYINGVTYSIVDESRLREMVAKGEDISTVCTTMVTDMANMFSYSSFNGEINSWDVGNVTSMRGMFSSIDIWVNHEPNPFDQDISSWDVSRVEDMSYMFSLSKFNHPIGSWDVSNVRTMKSMFWLSRFDQPIGNWDVSRVTHMAHMFAVSRFNQPIGNWDVSSVTDMNSMFIGAWGMGFVHPFNQDVGSWDVSSVLDMRNMFKESQINQDLSSWNVGSVIKCDGFSVNTPEWVLPKPNFTQCNLALSQEQY